jgi:hypothetical protein
LKFAKIKNSARKEYNNLEDSIIICIFAENIRNHKIVPIKKFINGNGYGLQQIIIINMTTSILE